MNERYYYTCPIKALYMMKEFGVEFDIKEIDNFVAYMKALYMMKEFGVEFDIKEIDNFVAYMKNPVYGVRINVATKSQKIFKFKKSDLVKYGFGSINFYNQISQKNSVSEIIYRDGKQFFMPEVEK